MDPAPALPPDRAILAPSERRAAVLGIIRQARSTLLLSLFRCNDKEIFRELKKVKIRGAELRITRVDAKPPRAEAEGRHRRPHPGSADRSERPKHRGSSRHTGGRRT